MRSKQNVDFSKTFNIGTFFTASALHIMIYDLIIKISIIVNLDLITLNPHN